MQAIREALERLNGAINGLDGTIDTMTETIRENLKGQQRDMFASSGLGTPSNENTQNEMTERIDNAISKVEKLLKEG